MDMFDWILLLLMLLRLIAFSVECYSVRSGSLNLPLFLDHFWWLLIAECVVVFPMALTHKSMLLILAVVIGSNAAAYLYLLKWNRRAVINLAAGSPHLKIKFLRVAGLYSIVFFASRMIDVPLYLFLRACNVL